jgi:hypothetical protein
MSDSLLFIDFEASSLNSKSYPIEVAWSNSDGSIESYLIKPEPEWIDWDEYVETEIHHISRKQLEEGKSVSWVTNRMNEVLIDQFLYTTGYVDDLFWCEKLFDAAGEYMLFQLDDAINVFSDEIEHKSNDIGDLKEKNRIRQQIEIFRTKAWTMMNNERHQASTDVAHLMMTWKLIKNRPVRL